eukprot:Hpha_TRINITY_DN15947_c0_g7::TRINITY_DN15947_c0_g7_i1::g.74970::m.74970
MAAATVPNRSPPSISRETSETMDERSSDTPTKRVPEVTLGGWDMEPPVSPTDCTPSVPQVSNTCHSFRAGGLVSPAPPQQPPVDAAPSRAVYSNYILKTSLKDSLKDSLKGSLKGSLRSRTGITEVVDISPNPSLRASVRQSQSQTSALKKRSSDADGNRTNALSHIRRFRSSGPTDVLDCSMIGWVPMEEPSPKPQPHPPRENQSQQPRSKDRNPRTRIRFQEPEQQTPSRSSQAPTKLEPKLPRSRWDRGLGGSNVWDPLACTVLMAGPPQTGERPPAPRVKQVFIAPSPAVELSDDFGDEDEESWCNF